MAVELDVWKQVCSPGADVRAVSYRCQRLGLFEWLLRPAWTGGDLSENAFKVAARMICIGWHPASVRKNGSGGISYGSFRGRAAEIDRAGRILAAMTMISRVCGNHADPLPKPAFAGFRPPLPV